MHQKSLLVTAFIFILLFLGIGAVVNMWLLPMLGIAVNGFEGEIIYALLLFLALVLAGSYTHHAKTSGL